MQTEAVWRALPRKIREVLAEKDLHDLQEIRLRSGQPLLLKRENRLFSLGKEGAFLPAADEKGMLHFHGGSARNRFASERLFSLCL